MDIGFLSAFIGGALALLSPCAALLLPAFFGSTVGAGPRLLLHGLIFYIGMLLVLIPLGMGAGSLGMLFTTHREVIVVTASVILIVLGALQFLGFGFDPARVLPGAGSARNRAASATGWMKTFLLGATSGVAGMCAGPILGAVLTLAAARGDIMVGGAMLAIYGAGMVAPLLVIAALWRRMGPRMRTVLRGRTFRFLGRDFHTVSMITGALMVAVGIIFWTTNGLVSVPSPLSTTTLSAMQEWVGAFSSPIVDVIAVIAIAAIAIGLWLFVSRRKLRTTPTDSDPAADSDDTDADDAAHTVDSAHADTAATASRRQQSPTEAPEDR